MPVTIASCFSRQIWGGSLWRLRFWRLVWGRRCDPLGRFNSLSVSWSLEARRRQRRAAQDQLEWKLKGESTGPAITLWEHSYF